MPIPGIARDLVAGLQHSHAKVDALLRLMVKCLRRRKPILFHDARGLSESCDATELRKSEEPKVGVLDRNRNHRRKVITCFCAMRKYNL